MSRASASSGRIVRWVAVPGVGIAFALLSVATIAGVGSMATSLGSASGLLSHPSFAPAQIAFAAPSPVLASGMRGASLAARENAVRARLASNVVVRVEKSARLVAAAPAKTIAKSLPQDRFERAIVKAALSHEKLAAAFARSGITVASAGNGHPAGVPLEERFFRVAAVPDRLGPAVARFGPRIAEPERSSRLALALAGSSQVELAFAAPAPLPSDALGRVFVSPEEPAETALNQDAPVFEDMPDSVPLPGRRPQLADRTPSTEEPQPRTVTPSKNSPPPKPAKRSNQSGGEMLAYAKPDNPGADGDSGGGLGQAFRNLFNGPSTRPQSGVAIYDISAATVTMPDGTKLEAHSGMGHMADNVRFVDQKMRGPTPPGTYKLTMRESRFHGVEAIRLTPVDGRNKYGRDGLLAHTEMLRGRPEQSNGCVAFKDYERFLKAFKKGKITRMVVVPSIGSASRMASNGRGA